MSRLSEVHALHEPGPQAVPGPLAEMMIDRLPRRAKIGGTLPATVLFEEVLRAKTLFFSFSTSDEKLHAPNEFMRIRRLREGMRAWEQLWRLLAGGSHRLATK